jgi:hypothetical protein
VGSPGLPPGYDAKYGGVSAYVAQISSPRGATLHGQFLAARAVWLQKHKGPGQRLSLQAKEDMFAAARSISTVKAEGVRVEQERTFVLEEHWDEAIHGGPLDESKIQEIEYAGRLVRGVLLDPHGGRKGELKVVQYGDVCLQDRTEEHTSGGPFDDIAAGHRLAALRGSLEEARRHREALAVQAPAPLDAAAVLSLLQQRQVLPQTGQTVGPPEVPAAALKVDEVQSSSDEDVGGAMRAGARLRSFGHAGSSAAPRTSPLGGAGGSRGGTSALPPKRARGAATQGTGATPRAGPIGGRPAASSAPAAVEHHTAATVGGDLPGHPRAGAPLLQLPAVPSPAAGLPSPGGSRKRQASGGSSASRTGLAATAVPAAGMDPATGSPAGVDGRTGRIASAVHEAQAEVEASLATCGFTETPGPSLRLGQEVLQELASRSASRTKTLRSAEAKLRAQLGRIGRSAHAADLQKEKEAVLALVAKTQAMARFNGLARQASPPPAEWAEAVQALRDLQVPIGLCHELLGLKVSILRALTFGEPAAAAAIFRETSAEVTSLQKRTRDLWPRPVFAQSARSHTQGFKSSRCAL